MAKDKGAPRAGKKEVAKEATAVEPALPLKKRKSASKEAPAEPPAPEPVPTKQKAKKAGSSSDAVGVGGTAKASTKPVAEAAAVVSKKRKQKSSAASEEDAPAAPAAAKPGKAAKTSKVVAAAEEAAKAVDAAKAKRPKGKLVEDSGAAPAAKKARSEGVAAAGGSTKAGKAESAKKAKVDGKVAKVTKPVKGAVSEAKSTAATASTSGSRLDRAQVERAVRALCTHLQRASGGAKALLEEDQDQPLNVVIATKDMPKLGSKSKTHKPRAIPLPHPSATLDDIELCLICKDPQREFKDKLADLDIKAKVIGVSKLKKKYVPYEAKRVLCSTYDTFIADKRVLPILPPLLGKTFFKKNKQPVAVDLGKTDLGAEIERAVCGTLFHQPRGVSSSIRVGVSSQSQAHLVENIMQTVERVVEFIPKSWSNIQSLHLRSTNSVALPFYNTLPHSG